MSIYKYLILFVFLNFLLISCGEMSETTIEEEPAVEITDILPENSLDLESVDLVRDTLTIEKLYEMPPGDIFVSGTYKAEYLDVFLPVKIAGFSGIPHTAGKINDGYRIIQSVSAQYKNNQTNSLITISIKDYGDEGIGGERNSFKVVPIEKGIITQKIENSMMEGFYFWNPVNREGFAKVLVNDRYAVQIDGYKITVDEPGVLDYLYGLPLKDLVEIGEKSNN